MKKRNKGPILLLALAFFLAGAKSPLAFCLWAFACLLFSMTVLRSSRVSYRLTMNFLALTAGLVLIQIYSLDPTNSLFWSVEYVVLSCLWLTLKKTPGDTCPDLFWGILSTLAFLTVIVTSYQWLRNSPAYGALPLNPNFNAVWMAALASAFIAKERKMLFEKVLTAAMVFLICYGHSRSGLLALATGVCYTWNQRRYPMRSIMPAAAIAACLGLLFIPHSWMLGRLNLFENGGRLRIWWLALRSTLDYPLTGFGPGNFEIAYQRYAFPAGDWVHYGRTTAFAHNDFLQAAVEFGWPLSVLLISGLIAALASPIRQDRPLAVPAKAILIVLCVASLFNPIFKMPILVYLAILAASCLVSPEPDASQDSQGVRGSFLLGIPVTAMLFVLACGARAYWANHDQWARILAWNSHDAQAWHELAYASSNNREALFDHQQAVKESPYEIYYAEALARTLESVPAPEEVPYAIGAYLNAIRLAPGRAINYLAVARLLWRAGEPAKALLWVEHARIVEPYYWESDLWRARCFESLGDKRRAREVLTVLIDRHSHFLQVSQYRPESPYEQTILSYDRSVIENELSHLNSR